ncbi:hypothetical protein TYRP_001394 [Tyrophagus putrescentiae]|nr:hypothetical protein TYRP_001394 [Tyrophagus putrescentiae]
MLMLLLLHKQQGLLRNNEEDEEVEVMSCKEAKPKSKLNQFTLNEANPTLICIFNSKQRN